MSLKEKLKLFGGYFFRWIGFSVEPRLMKLGNPNENSPVLLTCNFINTVNRVRKALEGLDCYLLIAPSHGINVWCGACGDDFSTDSIISILKTSRINELVDHNILILPQLSAPGINQDRIKKKLGWEVRFGPVYAKDIPEYLDNNFKKTREQTTVRFSVKQRIEMGNLYFFIVLFLFSVIFWSLSLLFSILDPLLFLNTVLLGFFMIYGSLLILPSINIRSSKRKVILYGIGWLILVLLYFQFLVQNLLYLIWNVITIFFLIFILSEDFHGLTPIYRSELGEKSWKEGKKEMKSIIGSFKLQSYGSIELDQTSCVGCKRCLDVCPRLVFEFREKVNKAILESPDKCINCHACVTQCLGKCLEID
jgi:NAD-dependent dihydropyrimidine dehydrogenase PreA subunit